VPVRLTARDLPEPDFILLRRLTEQRDIRPKEVLLVIDASDSTLAMDKGRELQMSAAAGIPEYWIVNLGENRLEVHRSPDIKAETYKDISIHQRDSVISP
jgi:Uma2 family endonuclease